ncbi:M20/M25/M40 family metallo-hydrolase [candidate division KSB1 bacterium]
MKKFISLLTVFMFIYCSDSPDYIVVSPGVEDIQYPIIEGVQKVIDIVDAVSEQSLRDNLTVLQDFYTRHTNSDTVSETRGIGAARRWIFSQFENSIQENPSLIEVWYDAFEQQINSGPLKLHKNVIYEQRGTEYPDRIFLAGAHMDSRNGNNADSEGFAPGANDDGSGTAAILELARILSGYTFKSTIMLVAFTGEEQGLHGSRHLAERFVAESVNIEGMIAVDMIGNSVGEMGNSDDSSARVFSQEPAYSIHRLLAAYVKVQGETYTDDFTVRLIPSIDRPGRGGDHITFTQSGFASVRLTESIENYDHQHNTEDIADYINFPYFTKNVKILAAVLAGLADAPPITQ